jgi:hypothetical protein
MTAGAFAKRYKEPIKKVAKEIIIACAAGGRGDPCTQ